MSESIEQPFSQEEDFKSGNEVYEKASLIVQTTSSCSKSCPECYLKENPEIKKEELNQERYEESISKLNEGDTIALRGGEITTIRDWFEKFVAPALNKGLKIIIETNGYFIGKEDYQSILEKINDERISVRISFDPEHLKDLKEENVSSEFEKMAIFAEDAESAGINFGFYSLGMNSEQIQKFVRGTPLEHYINKFHPLAFYPQISAVEIKGKYLKSNGNISDRIEA